MIWINLRTSDLRAPEYLGSAPIARATWLNVLAYSVEQENGGVIKGAATWGARQWQQIAGVTSEEVAAAAPLLVIVGSDVHVWGYPLEKQLQVQSKREQARDAANRRWSAKLGERVSHSTPKAACVTHCGRIAPRNAEEEVGRVNGKLVVVERTTNRPPPTDHASSFSAPASPGGRTEPVEDEATWVARLAERWPSVDIDAELRRATAKEGSFDRAWFETRWLPHAKPALGIAAAAKPATRVKPPAPPEQKGWRDEIATTQYGPGGSFEVATWQELPADVQKLIAARCADTLADA